MMRMSTAHGLVAGSLASLLLVGCGDEIRDLIQDIKRGDTQGPPKEPPPPPVPPEQPPSGSCVSAVQGSPMSCDSVAAWKRQASASCEATGLVLTDYAQSERCEGQDHYRYFKYTCCRPVPPPPPVSPPPGSCESHLEGGPTSCKDVATWRGYASQTCEGAGLLLREYTPSEDCGNGNYRYVRYTCCKPDQPPPPATMCERRQEGSPTSCKDVGTWKDHASQICEAGGLLLQDYEPGVDCGNGNYRYVRFSCCRSQPPSPPPPTVCESHLQGSAMSCEDASTWKDAAFRACQAAGLMLTDYIPTEDCASGKTRYVRYTCCR